MSLAQGMVGGRQFSVACPRMLVSINPGLLGGRAAGYCLCRSHRVGFCYKLFQSKDREDGISLLNPCPSGGKPCVGYCSQRPICLWVTPGIVVKSCIFSRGGWCILCISLPRRCVGKTGLVVVAVQGAPRCAVQLQSARQRMSREHIWLQSPHEPTRQSWADVTRGCQPPKIRETSKNWFLSCKKRYRAME